MARSNKTILTTLIVVVGAVAVVTGGLMASNMGFKLNYQLLDSGSSNSGTQTISLPYNRQVGIDTASALFSDIGGVQNIQKYVPATDTFQLYTFARPDFPLEEGVGYLIKMGTGTNYIIVGSHNPAAVIPLEAQGPTSNSGTNLFAPPYHGTSTTAAALFAEIGSGNTQNIQKYVAATDTYQLYTFGRPDFALVPGEAYLVKMANTVAFSPSHY